MERDAFISLLRLFFLYCSAMGLPIYEEKNVQQPPITINERNLQFQSDDTNDDDNNDYDDLPDVCILFSISFSFSFLSA